MSWRGEGGRCHSIMKRVFRLLYLTLLISSEIRTFEDLEKLFNDTTAFNIITQNLQTIRQTRAAKNLVKT